MTLTERHLSDIIVSSSLSHRDHHQEDHDDHIPLARRVPNNHHLSNDQNSLSGDDSQPLSRLKRPGKRARSSSETLASDHRSSNLAKKSRVVNQNSSVTACNSAPPKSATSPPSKLQKRRVKKESVKQPKNDTSIQPNSTPTPSTLAHSTAPDAQDRQEQDAAGYRWWDESGSEDKSKIKWNTLVHNAVMFPPEYEPHGIPMYYNDSPIELSPQSEEFATFYAAKLATDYVKKPTFQRNFFEDFRASLHGTAAFNVVKKLEFCDFSHIFNHLETKKAEKKEIPAAEKKLIREAESLRCKKYTVALVDGRDEKVGNYRVEPPGLFLGRGEHPKMGKIKSRIYPEDVTINIGEDGPIPECPMEGHKWGSIVHKKDVTWLCGWKDSITGGSKYVWLAAGSAFKGMSDHAKFEKARKLSQYIEGIRREYRNDWKAKSKEIRQRAVAMYLIDKLALRVGNEKGEEEADTVGCCSLRVEHIQFEPPRTVIFDFLGKDSIRYFNSVEVEKYVFDALKLFCRGKEPGDEIFHRLSVTGLNDYLKSCMEGLSAKVFRTFNASQTLDRLLHETPPKLDLNNKIVFYNQQNKEVAILCNHQRALPKAHGTQMEKMDKRLNETSEWLEELKRGRSKLKKEKEDKATVELTQWMPEKPNLTDEMDDKERAAERKRASEAPRVSAIRKKNLSQIEAAIKAVNERLAKLKADMQVKEDLKTVALGTSKINYLDPRITVAWCKKHNVPIERIFAKTLLVKFAWAMEASENFRF